MSLIQDLKGTSFGSFLLGIGGVLMKNSGGNLLVRNPGDTADATITASKLNNTGNTIDLGSVNVLTFSRNSAQGGALTLIVPAAKATDGQVLAQKAGTAAGVIELEFITAAGTADKVTTDTTSLAFGSGATVTMFTLPANATISFVRVIIDTPFSAGASMSVGVSGTVSKYMAANQVSLQGVAGDRYESYPGLVANSSPEALIISYTASGATAGAARIEVGYAVPS